MHRSVRTHAHAPHMYHAHTLTHAHTLANTRALTHTRSLTHIPIHTHLHIDTLCCYLHMYKYIQNSKTKEKRNNNIEIKKCNKVLKVNCLAAASAAAAAAASNRIPLAFPSWGLSYSCCCLPASVAAAAAAVWVHAAAAGQGQRQVARSVAVALLAGWGLRIAVCGAPSKLCAVFVSWRYICAPDRANSVELFAPGGRHARTYTAHEGHEGDTLAGQRSLWLSLDCSQFSWHTNTDTYV